MIRAEYDATRVGFEGWSGDDDRPHLIMDILRRAGYSGDLSDE